MTLAAAHWPALQVLWLKSNSLDPAALATHWPTLEELWIDDNASDDES